MTPAAAHGLNSIKFLELMLVDVAGVSAEEVKIFNLPPC
jgi:hypothetical protein